MADNPRPKKKSRLQEWVHSSFKISSKKANRPKTPPGQVTDIPSEPIAPSHLHNNFGPGSHAFQSAAVAHPLAALVSPTTVTAAAFRSLTFEDHRQQLGQKSRNLLGQNETRTVYTGHSELPQKVVKNVHAVTQDANHAVSPQQKLLQPTSNGHTASSSSVSSNHASQKTVDPLPHATAAGIQNQFPPIYQLPLPPFSTLATSASQNAENIPPQQAANPQRAPTSNRYHHSPIVGHNDLIESLEPPLENYRPEGAPRHPGTALSSQQCYYQTPDGTRHTETPLNLYTSYDYQCYQSLPLESSVPDIPTPKKRKFTEFTSPTPILPPPAHIYRRTNNPTFNVFHGLLLYPELCYHLALHLPLSNLISLYAISKDYHIILDTRFTTLIISLANHLAPTATKVFPFRCYRHLCRVDPAARIPHPDPVMAAQGAIRKIPSFKWLKMLLYREKVVHEILALAAQKGVPFPRRCGEVLMKFWFMLDIPDNATRIGYIHNVNLFTDLDLYFGMCVVVKLDMLFNDPVGTEKRDGGRRLVLSQRSLTTLLLVLRGELWTSKLEVLREWVRWKYEPSERDLGGCGNAGVWGVPLAECGRLKHQYWGREAELQVLKAKALKEGKQVLWLLRPDQMIVREAVRRGLRFQGHVLKCLLYGYVDPRTLEDLDFNEEGRDVQRREKGLDGHAEYDFDDLVGGACSVAVEDGGDRLLDLGKKNVGSRRCEKEGMSEQERSWREGERAFTQQCYGWWRGELRAEGLSVEDIVEWENE